MKIPDVIYIALGTDDKYCKYAGCCIASILLSAEKEDRFCFYVVDNGISAKNKSRLAKLQKLRPHELVFLKPDMVKLQDLPQCAYLGLSTYLRLLLPELLPEADRLLYLDCDMIVTKSLSELWNADLHGKAAGVVEDYGEHYNRRAEALGIDFYFNAGMLLLDLKQIRERELFREVMNWTLENPEKVKFGDQDGLNVILRNDYMELPALWNIQINPYETKKYPDASKIQALDECAGVLHYITSLKPDMYDFLLPQKKHFLTILRKTPWRECIERASLKKKWKRFRSTSVLYQRFRKLRSIVRNCFKRSKDFV